MMSAFGGKADLTPQRLNPLPVRNSAGLRSAVPVVTNDGTIVRIMR